MLNVRILGWQEEWFPSRIVATSGRVVWPEHLLRDNRCATLLGEPDTWTYFRNPERGTAASSITVEMKPYVPYPQSMGKGLLRDATRLTAQG